MIRIPVHASNQHRLFSVSRPVSSLFQDYVKKIQPGIKEITCVELNSKVTADPFHGMPAALHILDVREPVEWNEECLPFSRYTGRGTLERDIEQYVADVSDIIVVYCASGKRSILACDALNKMGYQNVYSLKGGISEWKKTPLAVIKNVKTYSDIYDYGIESNK